FKSSIVNSFGLRHLAMRPAPDFFRGGQADANRVEICNGVCQVKWARTEQDFLHFLRPYRCRPRLRIKWPVISSQWPVTWLKARELIAVSCFSRLVIT